MRCKSITSNGIDAERHILMRCLRMRRLLCHQPEDSRVKSSALSLVLLQKNLFSREVERAEPEAAGQRHRQALITHQRARFYLVQVYTRGRALLTYHSRDHGRRSRYIF